jgi:hypothetical protein
MDHSNRCLALEAPYVFKQPSDFVSLLKRGITALIEDIVRCPVDPSIGLESEIPLLTCIKCVS